VARWGGEGAEKAKTLESKTVAGLKKFFGEKALDVLDMRKGGLKKGKPAPKNWLSQSVLLGDVAGCYSPGGPRGKGAERLAYRDVGLNDERGTWQVQSGHNVL